LSIIESLKANEGQIDNVLEQGESVKVRGDLHTLIRLSDVFNCNVNRNKLSNGIIMIVEDMMSKKIGLYVDDIIGQQQVVIKNLGSSIGDIQGISGGAIMSDGTVSLILDVGGLVRMATS
jgi:two-component system chemotaxis sensor kinase CheA